MSESKLNISTNLNVSEDKLQKQLSPINVWALALGCIIGWGAFIMPGEIFLVKAGPLGTALAMIIATVILTIIAINYYYMITRYPEQAVNLFMLMQYLAKKMLSYVHGF